MTTVVHYEQKVGTACGESLFLPDLALVVAMVYTNKQAPWWGATSSGQGDDDDLAHGSDISDDAAGEDDENISGEGDQAIEQKEDPETVARLGL